jgi:hypothetical protein
MAAWTKEAPTKPGYYWRRESELDKSPAVVFYKRGRFDLAGGEIWSNPIFPPYSRRNLGLSALKWKATKRVSNIDHLPTKFQNAIVYLRVHSGTWADIEKQSALPYDHRWKTTGGGFINWDDLGNPVLMLFSDKRLSKTTLRNWFNLHVENAKVLKRRR